jgi:hypothetical protein
MVIGVSSVLSLAAGAAAGYFLTKKKLEKQYDELVKREIAEAKKFYSALHKKGDFATPAAAVDKLLGVTAPAPLMDEAVEALHNYQGVNKYHPGVVTKPSVQEVIANVFQKIDAEEEVDFEKEKRNRTEEAPYIVSKEEFLENEPEYTQDTLTFYAGDDVLADQQDQVVENVNMTVGLDCLRFGYRSGDKNVVYVRNDSLERDFEILRSEGKYGEEVAGLRSD